MSKTAVMPAYISMEEVQTPMAKTFYILNRWVRILSSYGEIDSSTLNNDFKVIHQVIKSPEITRSIKTAILSCRDRLLGTVHDASKLAGYIKSVLKRISESMTDSFILQIKQDKKDKGMRNRYSHLLKKLSRVELKGTGTKLSEIDVDMVDSKTAATVRRIVEKRAAQSLSSTMNRNHESNLFRQKVRRAKSFTLYYTYEGKIDDLHREASTHWVFKREKESGLLVKRKKHGFATKEEALEAVERWNTSHPHDEIPMVAYQCAHCGKWHIGHNRSDTPNAEAVSSIL